MFKFNEFIIENLINGYKEGSFTETQINIFAMNYHMRGQITRDEFDFILDEIRRIDLEKLEEEKSENAVAEPPMIEEETEIEDTDESVMEEENTDDPVIEETEEQEESDVESSES